MKAKNPVGPRELKDPRSPEYARQTISALRLWIESERIEKERIEKELTLIRKYRHWEVLGYSSEDELLRAEVGIGRSDIKRLAESAEKKPLAKHGGDRKSEEGNQESTLSHNVDRQGTSADYLTRRIARDCPEVLERMKAGEFKSVRAAAIEAGIVKPDTPADKLRKAFAKIEADHQFSHLRSLIEQATPEARAALRLWLSECEDEVA